MGAIHHFLKGGIYLVACFLDHITAYGWLEGTLESNLNFVFWQGVVADGSIVILLPICKEIGTLELLDNTWECNHAVSKLLDVLHELWIVLPDLFVEAKILVLIYFIDLLLKKNSDGLKVVNTASGNFQRELDHKVTLGLGGELFELAFYIHLVIT